MFRGTQKTELSKKNFGAGSIIKVSSEEYLVVAQGSSVRLLHLSDFELIGPSVPVEDANFLSRAEVDKLIAPLQCARSDCDYIAKGLKA